MAFAIKTEVCDPRAKTFPRHGDKPTIVPHADVTTEFGGAPPERTRLCDVHQFDHGSDIGKRKR